MIHGKVVIFMKTLDLIIPCYNEQEALPLLMRELAALRAQLVGYTCRLIFVDDGSTDGTLGILKSFAAADADICYISFSRNFGKEAAMLAGLRASAADFVGILDADLQHSPALLPAMLQALEEGYDVAAARRTDRSGENKSVSRLSDRFYRVADRLSDVHLDAGAQDFRVMRRSVADALLSMPEHRRFTKGLFSFVGFRTKWFPHDNAARVAGETKWSLKMLARYACDGILGFSDRLLLLPLWAGAFLLIGSLLALLVQLILRVCTAVQVSAVHVLIAVCCLLTGLVLLALGVLGAYLARVLSEVRGRPQYIIRESSLKTP